MIEEMGIRKLVKYLIVKNPLYEIGLKDIILPKILQEEIENQFLISYRLLDNDKEIRTHKYTFSLKN
jgi:hypothetical protein